MIAHPIYREISLLPLLLVCFCSSCHGSPEYSEYVQSSSDVLNNVSLTPRATSIHVSLDANNPEEDELPREYRVRWQHQGVIRGNLYINDATETTISGLEPCTEYALSVTLIDATGEPTGALINKTTSTISKAPPAVTGLESQTSTPKIMTLSWERPNTACEVTSYRIQLSGVTKWGSHASHEDVKFISDEMADSTTRYELEGLLPHTDYSVSIVANTTAGAGGKATTHFTTPEGEPSKPVNLSTTKPTANSITATWDEPAEMNGVLTYYFISWYSDDELIGSEKERYRAHTIAGLSPCVEYKIRVAASTAGGEGDYIEITQQTDVGAPFHPLDLSCGLNPNQTISVSWAKPETSCSITGFEVLWPKSSLEPKAMLTKNVPPSNLSTDPIIVSGLPFRVCVAAATSDAMIGPQSCCVMIESQSSFSTSHPPTAATNTTEKNTSGGWDASQGLSHAACTKMTIGIVSGVVVIACVAVVGFVFWRRSHSPGVTPTSLASLAKPWRRSHSPGVTRTPLASLAEP